MDKPKYIHLTTERMRELIGKHLDLPPMIPLGRGWIADADQWQVWKSMQPSAPTQ